MKDQQANRISLEEQMLRSMSMSIYGKQVESRCRVLTNEQKAGLEALGMQKLNGLNNAKEENRGALDSWEEG